MRARGCNPHGSSIKGSSLLHNVQAFRKMANYALVRESTMTAEMSEETVDIVVGGAEALHAHGHLLSRAYRS